MKFTFLSFLYSIFFLTIITVSGCDLIKPKAEVPAYISIDRFILITDSVKQGSASHKITDAWVFVDDKLIGIYELPAKFPVIASGTQNVKIRAGIKFNGIVNDRIIYPFYHSFDTLISLNKLQSFSINPIIKYEANAKFTYLENFEGQIISLIKSIASDTTVQLIAPSNPATYRTTHCGAGFLNTSGKKFDFISAQAYPFTKGINIILEMDYKCNQLFTIGLIASTKGNFEKEGIVTLNSTEDKWKKIYVNLASFINVKSYADNFTLFLRCVKEPATETSQVYFDNIKIVNE